jgi:hypothetical protein
LCSPNYRLVSKIAHVKLREIEQYLKSSGLLVMNDNEKLEAELDDQFPKATRKQIVEYKGKSYQRIFSPLEKSRSRKTVTEWGKTWIEI